MQNMGKKHTYVTVDVITIMTGFTGLFWKLTWPYYLHKYCVVTVVFFKAIYIKVSHYSFWFCGAESVL